MANEVPGERALFYDEDVQYRAAVSESLLSKVAKTNNFLVTKHIETKSFEINGNYGPAILATLPFLAIDGARPFLYAVEIVDIWVFNRIKGSSGTTELDIKWKAMGSSTWVSIFTGVGGVTPKIASTASDYEACGMGDTVTGFVAAVPVKTTFAAGDMIRMDLISSMAGTPNGCEIVISYRPI